MANLINRRAPILKLISFLILLGGSAISVGLFIDVGSNTVFLASLEKTIVRPSVNQTPPAVMPAVSRTSVAPSRQPRSVFLSVPFVVQAPLGEWTQPWQDACEEASVLMAAAWRNNKTFAPAEIRDKILGMVDYEIYNFGYHRNTNLKQTSKLLTDFLGLDGVRLEYGIKLDDIKNELAKSNLVIVPAAGRILAQENPYFIGPPVYHMVVVRGYDDVSQEIIVNDPGTKYGQAFRYSYELFQTAIHDWTGSEKTLLLGKSGMIVIPPTYEL